MTINVVHWRVMSSITQDITWPEFKKLCKDIPQFNLNQVDGLGVTVLAKAAYVGNYVLVEKLVNNMPELINKVNFWGWSPFFYAILCEDHIRGFLAAKILFEAGTDPNLTSTVKSFDAPAGVTPFWVATKTKRLAIRALLMPKDITYSIFALNSFNFLPKELIKMINLSLMKLKLISLPKYRELYGDFDLSNR